MFIEILFKMLLFKGGVLIYAEHCISDSSTQLLDHGCHTNNVITIDLFQLSKGHSAHGVDNNAHLSQINPVSTQYF